MKEEPQLSKLSLRRTAKGYMITMPSIAHKITKCKLFHTPSEDFSFPRSELLDLATLGLEKEKSSLGKGSWALSFSISGILVSGPTEHLLPSFVMISYRIGTMVGDILTCFG